MISISLFSLWSSWYSYSVHCQPTHIPRVYVCVFVPVYIYIYLVCCVIFFFSTWRIDSCSISLYWLLFSFTYFRLRAPMVLSSWLTMRQTTRTMWVLHAHANTDAIPSQLLTLPVFLSLLSSHTHTDEPHNDQTPLSRLLVWFYVKPTLMRMSPVNCASLSTVITHQLEVFCSQFTIIAAILIKLHDIDRQ